MLDPQDQICILSFNFLTHISVKFLIHKFLGMFWTLINYPFSLFGFEIFIRNYDALMIKSMHSNIIDDVDKVRHWFSALLCGSSTRTTHLPDLAE